MHLFKTIEVLGLGCVDSRGKAVGPGSGNSHGGGPVALHGISSRSLQNSRL